MRRHLLVTNDFPPKHGGIQSYLWELWRRLDPASFVVMTTPFDGAAAWDAEQPFAITRTAEHWLVPKPSLVRRIDELAAKAGAELVVLDPALPLGLIGPHLRVPYGIVLHGAEVTVPRRLPGARTALRRVVRGAQVIIAAGGYPAAEAEHVVGRQLPTAIVPPGVDVDRFVPLGHAEVIAARQRLQLSERGPLLLSLSRLVPRKGMDVLVRAAALLAPTAPDLTVAIAGDGRDRPRLERLIRRSGAPARLLGRVHDADLPALYGAADVFAMLCRDRWAGLEQEGFGIVFLEAASSGVPQVAGHSGGAAEAVVHGETGVVAYRPGDAHSVAGILSRLLDDGSLRGSMGRAARARAVAEFSYDTLASKLEKALAAW